MSNVKYKDGLLLQAQSMLVLQILTSIAMVMYVAVIIN